MNGLDTKKMRSLLLAALHSEVIIFLLEKNYKCNLKKQHVAPLFSCKSIRLALNDLEFNDIYF